MKIGIAGTPPQAKWTNWDAWYAWSICDLGRKKTAPLHKLKRKRSGDPDDKGSYASWDAVEWIVEQMIRDTVGKRMGRRVLQLLNEPRSSRESDWADSPREAATWVARAILSVRAFCPWVQFAGPNLWPSEEGETWLWEFFDELERRRAPLDIYAVHGYTIFWDEAGFLDHLEDVIVNASSLQLAGEAVWITEIGDLWGSDLKTVRGRMKQTEGFLIRNAEKYDIDACLWFVSRDKGVHGYSPNTEIYDADDALTRQGRTWWEVWRRMSRGGM